MPPQTSLDAAKLMLTLCLGFCTAAAGEETKADRAVTLKVIHTLENPRDVMRPGPCGELGPYQFREPTWRSYTNEPFERALDRALSDTVAERHYEWLKRRLEAAGVPVTTYTIALAWNAGVGPAITGRAPRKARDYAQRAVNLATAIGGDEAVATSR